MKEQTDTSKIQSRILDIFHDANLRVEDYYMELLILCLCKYEIIEEEVDTIFSDFFTSLKKKLTELDSDKAKFFLPIISPFKTTLIELSNNAINEIINLSKELILISKPDEFSEIFDQMLYTISKGHGRHGGEIIQPLELTKLLINLADLPANARVFNPFAGLASFGAFLEQNQYYSGQELNPKTWAIGQLRLMAHNRTELSQFACEDSVENWPDFQEKFDLVISHPPFLSLSISGKRNQKQIDEPRYRLIEQFLVYKGIQSLKQNGKLIALLPQGFLFRSIEGELREHLVNEDLIDTIISLPGGILSNTGIEVIILIINFNKSHPGLIRFIKGNDFENSRSRSEKTLDYAKLNHLAKCPFENSQHVRIVNLEQIRLNNFNLQVPRYFQKSIEGTKLKDLLEPIRGNSTNKFKEGKLVRIRDLKDDKIDFNLEESKIEMAELSHPQIKEINESCLLLATRWKTIKPTWFEYKNESIFLRLGDIQSFRINEKLVDKTFLISELDSDYVKDQLESFRVGGTIPFIRKDDLLDVVIKLTSIEDQRKKVDLNYVENLIEDKVKLEKIRQSFNEELGVKQHNIRQHLKNVKDSLDALIGLMNDNGGILNKNDMINPIRNVTVEKRFKRMYSSLESVIIEVKNLTNKHSFGDPVLIDFIEILTKSIEERSQENYEIFFTRDEVALKGLELDQENQSAEFDEESPGLEGNSNEIADYKILFSEKDFKELINNVVENAEKHGFANSSKNHKIIFDISLENNFLLLTIKNNGNPFPKNITKSFGIKGAKAGKSGNQGIGVWKIIQSILHFGHEYEVIDEPEKEYPVGWIFKFKLLN